MAKKPTALKTVEAFVHDEAKRKNIPTAEHQSVVQQDDKKPIRIRYLRNTDLDPQFVWRGKDEQDWSDLVITAPPLYIQEKVHPKALIDDLLRQTKEEEHDAGKTTADLFADFDGIPKEIDKTEFYSHDQNWSNRMILGDSLQVMASLVEREGLRGQVQAIFFDPPYGIKFNSNFQWSTTNRNVTDGKSDHITREPEQVKAFRDTWKDGIHSYLTYLRDRLTVARDLLNSSGSIFIQIGDENVHRARALLDEIFGDDNFVSQISFEKTSGFGSQFLENTCDYILWFAKDKKQLKYRSLLLDKVPLAEGGSTYTNVMYADGREERLTKEQKENLGKLPSDARLFSLGDTTSDGGASVEQPFVYQEEKFSPGANRHWSVKWPEGMNTLAKSGRLRKRPNGGIAYLRFYDDFPARPMSNTWSGTSSSFSNRIYVVQTTMTIVERCLLMASDPGDLILDPTCGSGTSAVVAEQWGRRWITIDTSRVALALARTRLMGSRFPFYLLTDSIQGQRKEAELTQKPESIKSTYNNIRHGFVCDRVPHITVKSIADNREIETIYENWNSKISNLITDINKKFSKKYKEFDIHINMVNDIQNDELKTLVLKVVDLKLDRQKEIDRSIIRNAQFEYRYDKPYEDKKKVRVAGPFTVESLSPHRALSVDENDDLIDNFIGEDEIPKQSFTQMILDNLKVAGVQQAHKENKIQFSSLTPWCGNLVCAEGRYFEGTEGTSNEKRAAIFIGPEFGTVQRADLVQAAREAGDAGFDSLIACAFNYEAHATELNNLGSIPILKARVNADLHMSEDLKNTGKGNLFVIFGEPDIDVIQEKEDKIRVKVNGVDVFKPQTGEVVSDGADGIACWFVDTDYNEESFFVRQAYFLGANDPYSSLKNTLKAEINADAWATLNSDTSRPFSKPKSGRIAVKVINHLGDEVMKVFKV
jgi:adenine-specific DNA-methyltransferase